MNENLMKYKGYTAKVVFSDSDGCLIGKILGIDDSVTFEGGSVAEIRNEFKIALNDYLSYCMKIGKQPDRPYSGKLMIRLSPETHKAVAASAEAKGISINEAVSAAVKGMYAIEPATPKKHGRARGKTAKHIKAI